MEMHQLKVFLFLQRVRTLATVREFERLTQNLWRLLSRRFLKENGFEGDEFKLEYNGAFSLEVLGASAFKWPLAPMPVT